MDDQQTFDVYAQEQNPADHLGLVYMAAGRMANAMKGERDDFIGPAYIALVESIQTWDASKGHRFSTHAMKAIRFKAYGMTKKDAGYRRDWRDRYGWVKEAKSITNRDGEDLDIGTPDPLDAIADEEQRHADNEFRINKLVGIAYTISPQFGPRAVLMMAKGIQDKEIARKLGRGKAWPTWLRMQIRRVLNGKEHLVFVKGRSRTEERKRNKVSGSPPGAGTASARNKREKSYLCCPPHLIYFHVLIH